MAEVPEHLLRRSRERRAALGLSGATVPGGEAPAAPADGDVAAVAPAVVADAPAGASTAPVTAAPPGPPAVTTEAAPSPSALAAEAIARTRLPMWMMPVLVVLPFWGFLYMGAFGDRGKVEVVDPLVLGEQVYKGKGCSACHGAAGEGGTGPALTGGASALTFPEEADHEAWIKSGSGGVKGQLYGDPDRPGGQAGPAKGIMPGFPTLSEAELKAVVAYEREKL